jgi:hypothetical protein
MDIYVKKFKNAYYVVTPNKYMCNSVNKEDDKKLCSKTYVNIARLATYLLGGDYISSLSFTYAEAMDNFNAIAKRYNCKFIKAYIGQIKFPVFKNKDDATAFMNALNATMVLNELNRS